MIPLPFSFNFLEVQMPNSSKSELQSCLKLILVVTGVILNGGLLSVLEEDWGTLPLQEIPKAYSKIKCYRLSELLVDAFDLFPPDKLNNLQERQHWAWGKTKGSERVPECINTMQSAISDLNLAVDSYCVCFVLDNLSEFPEHLAVLNDYVSSLHGPAPASRTS